MKRVKQSNPAVESVEQQLAVMGFSEEEAVLGAKYGQTLQQASMYTD
jgi:hypothetical protein